MVDQDQTVHNGHQYLGSDGIVITIFSQVLILGTEKPVSFVFVLLFLYRQGIIKFNESDNKDNIFPAITSFFTALHSMVKKKIGT